MSSLQRMLSILDMFSIERPVVSADEIMSHYGFSRGTAYRYIRELCNSGLLSHVPGAYVLGPRIVELDHYIRASDPILQVSEPVTRRLRDELSCDVLLTSYYEGRVVVSHHERGRDEITVSYGRGRVMPLFEGAGSKIIIAFLPETRQRKLFERHKHDIRDRDLAADWGAFRASLEQIRNDGFSISFGELDSGNVGVAAPIMFDDQRANLGSIVLVFDEARYAVLDQRLITDIAVEAAGHIDRLLAERSQKHRVSMDWLDQLKERRG